jgi:hypothetical protein
VEPADKEDALRLVEDDDDDDDCSKAAISSSNESGMGGLVDDVEWKMLPRR